MNRRGVIRAIEGRREELRARGVAHVYLFGSTARDEATAASDIDIFVDLKRGTRFSLFDLMDLRDDLSETLKARADVFLRQSLHRAIRRDIEAEAIRVF
jgi:hypothetical protein